MKYFFIFLFLIESSYITAQENIPVMFQIKTEVEIPEDFKDGIDETLISLNYSVIDSIKQEETIKEQSDKTKKKCNDEKCFVVTGKLLAAKGLIIIEISEKSTQNHKFKLKFIDVETGITKVNISKYYKNDLKEFELLKQFGKDLTNEMHKILNNESISENNDNSNETDKENNNKQTLKENSEDSENIKGNQSISIEFAGAGIGISLMYSHKFFDYFAFNVGIGYPVFPYFSCSLLLGNNIHSFELLAGVANSLVDLNEYEYNYYDDFDEYEKKSTIMPHAGVGYRYSSQDGGFFFRVTAYIFGNIMGLDQIFPYGGTTLGYAF